MKRTLCTLAVVAALTTSSFAEGLGLGADAYFTNNGYDNSTNTANETAFNIQVFLRIPYGTDLEVTPFVGYYSDVQKDEKSMTSSVSDDYAWTAFSFGSGVSKKLVSAGPLSLLAGGRVFVSISGGGDKSYQGDKSGLDLSVSAPLTLDYQVTPSFVLRATATVVELDYSAYTEKPTVGNTWKVSGLSISSFQSGIPVGFYFVF